MFSYPPRTKLDWALRHLQDGWAALPVRWVLLDGRCTCGRPPENCKAGNHLLWIEGTAEHGSLSATTDEEQVRRWWEQYPAANIGLAADRKSGRVVLDVDYYNGGGETVDLFGPPELRAAGNRATPHPEQ